MTDADTQEHGFGWALEQVRRGERVERAGWNGKGMWIALQVPDAGSKMGLPYLYMKTADHWDRPPDGLYGEPVNIPGPLVPWLASQTDMLAFDWRLTPKGDAR